MFWAVMLVCFLVNVFGAKYLDLINKACIYWTSASVIIILVVLLKMAPVKRSGEFVFAHYDASASGWYVALPLAIPDRAWTTCFSSKKLGSQRSNHSDKADDVILGLLAGHSSSVCSKLHTP